MLYWLADLSDNGGVFNLFRYITFRSGAAFFTALIFGFIFGRPLIDWLRVKQKKGQPLREIGPDHFAKAGTPTMGGILILSALFISTLLWARLDNGYVWIVLLVTAAFAAMMVLGRFLRQTPDRDLVLFQLVAALIGGLLLAPFDWQPLRSGFDLALLFLLGVVATAAHMLVTRALKLADAPVVAPLQYTLLVWGIALGYLVFGDIPATGMLIGAALIVASGLMVLRTQKPPATAAPSDPATKATAATLN